MLSVPTGRGEARRAWPSNHSSRKRSTTTQRPTRDDPRPATLWRWANEATDAGLAWPCSPGRRDLAVEQVTKLSAKGRMTRSRAAKHAGLSSEPASSTTRPSTRRFSVSTQRPSGSGTPASRGGRCRSVPAAGPLRPSAIEPIHARRARYVDRIMMHFVSTHRRSE